MGRLMAVRARRFCCPRETFGAHPSLCCLFPVSTESSCKSSSRDFAVATNAPSSGSDDSSSTNMALHRTGKISHSKRVELTEITLHPRRLPKSAGEGGLTPLASGRQPKSPAAAPAARIQMHS